MAVYVLSVGNYNRYLCLKYEQIQFFLSFFKNILETPIIFPGFYVFYVEKGKKFKEKAPKLLGALQNKIIKAQSLIRPKFQALHNQAY